MVMATAAAELTKATRAGRDSHAIQSYGLRNLEDHGASRFIAGETNLPATREWRSITPRSTPDEFVWRKIAKSAKATTRTILDPREMRGCAEDGRGLGTGRRHRVFRQKSIAGPRDGEDVRGGAVQSHRHPLRSSKLLRLSSGIKIRRQFRTGPILRTDDFAVETAFAVDDVSFWIHCGAVGAGDLFDGSRKFGKPD